MNSIKQVIERATVGWNYRTMVLSKSGWRHIGREARGITDDFGFLVFIGENYTEK